MRHFLFQHDVRLSSYLLIGFDNIWIRWLLADRWENRVCFFNLFAYSWQEFGIFPQLSISSRTQTLHSPPSMQVRAAVVRNTNQHGYRFTFGSCFIPFSFKVSLLQYTGLLLQELYNDSHFEPKNQKTISTSCRRMWCHLCTHPRSMCHFLSLFGCDNGRMTYVCTSRYKYTLEAEQTLYFTHAQLLPLHHAGVIHQTPGGGVLVGCRPEVKMGDGGWW